MFLAVIIYIALIGSVISGYFAFRALSELSDEGKVWWFPLIFLGLYVFASREDFTDLGWQFRMLALKIEGATLLLLIILTISYFAFVAS